MPTRRDLAIHIGVLSRIGVFDKLVELAKEHHVSLDDILSDSRSKSVMQARLACYAYLRGLGMSYPEIGKLMLRDHTTVLYALQSQAKKDKRRRDRQAAADAAAEGARAKSRAS